ncbi:MAG: hypothetical protein Q4F34_07615 [Prevotellaceae bacterium]|nr:hypothetical protein [Prevotellaceae bacterium]
MKKIVLSVVALFVTMSVNAQTVKVYLNNGTTPVAAFVSDTKQKYRVAFQEESASVPDVKCVKVNGHYVYVILGEDAVGDVSVSTQLNEKDGNFKISAHSDSGVRLECEPDKSVVVDTATVDGYFSVTFPTSNITENTIFTVDHYWKASGLPLTIGGHSTDIVASSGSEEDIIKVLYHNNGETVSVRAHSDKGTLLNLSADNCTVSGGWTGKSVNYEWLLSDITGAVDAEIDYGISVKFNVRGSGLIHLATEDGIIAEDMTLYEPNLTLCAVPESENKFFRWNTQAVEEGTSTKTFSLYDNTTITAEFIDENLISGLFTVNESGKQVFFSKGNLWYGPLTESADATWNLEDKQYTNSWTIDWNHISNFFWCSKASNSIQQTRPADDTDNTFFANQPGFEANGRTWWSVLTADEWDYVLKKRNASTIEGETDARYVRCCIHVNKIYPTGLLIFPDAFIWPTDVKSKGLASLINFSGTDFNYEFTKDEFEKLSAAGAVFIPISGRRFDGGTSLSNLTYGYYWSATRCDWGTTIQAYSLNFWWSSRVGSDTPYCQSPLNEAYLVRLVKAYE